MGAWKKERKKKINYKCKNKNKIKSNGKTHIEICMYEFALEGI